MSHISPGEARRLLASGFEGAGWEYDLVTGKSILEAAEDADRMDGTELARVVPASFLERNGISREDVAAVIDRAVGGRKLQADPGTPTVLNFDNRSYSLRVESGGQISGSQVNVGGTQINVQAGADRGEVLTAVAALFRAGLANDWNPAAAAELAAVIDARDDIGFEDVEKVAIETAESTGEPPDEGRVRAMLRSITEQGIGGALGTGISAAVGWLLRNPPV